MLFHVGALMRLNELGVLSRVARISSVSGGSIAAGYLACVWNQLGPPNAVGAFDLDAVLARIRLVLGMVFTHRLMMGWLLPRTGKP
jgi:NTE family protein